MREAGPLAVSRCLNRLVVELPERVDIVGELLVVIEKEP